MELRQMRSIQSLVAEDASDGEDLTLILWVLGEVTDREYGGVGPQLCLLGDIIAVGPTPTRRSCTCPMLMGRAICSGFER